MQLLFIFLLFTNYLAFACRQILLRKAEELAASESLNDRW